MKIHPIIAAVIIIGFTLGFSAWVLRPHDQTGVHWETPSEERAKDVPTAENLARWRAADLAVMRADATNSIVGFRRLTDSRITDFDDAVSNWTGTVTAEYFNSVGGVDRTNYLYRFRVFEGDVKPEVDSGTMLINSLHASN